MEVLFEPFRYPEKLKDQRRLFMECFPENAGTPVETVIHYNWKFKSFPVEKPSYEYVAKLDNELIGYYAAIPYEYVVNGSLFRAAMVCDVMTGVKARGKGVFTKLGLYSTNQFKTEGLAFSTGYPIRSEVIPGHKKAGWDFPFQIPMYGRFLKMNSFLRSRGKSYLIPLANIAVSVFNGFANLKLFKQNDITIEKYQSDRLNDIHGLNEFFQNWINENPVALNKNVKFLRWRLGAPEKKYEIIVIRSKTNQQIAGYSIFRSVEKEGVPCIGVLDFCFLNAYSGLSKTLLSEIFLSAKTLQAELILMMMMRSKARLYKLTSNGFLKTPFLFSFIIKQFDRSIDPDLLKNEGNWSLMWIDSDDL